MTGDIKPQQDIREVEYADISMVESTNSKLNEDVVRRIERQGWVKELGLALPAFFTGKSFIITDGNHRLEALKRMGHKWVPVVRLTKEEFDYVKYSDRHVDFLIAFPEKPLHHVPTKDFPANYQPNVGTIE